MTNTSERDRLVVIVGPTGSGKTHWSIELAKQIDSEIISADSRYLVRELNIGTAKPSETELSQVRHHLINVSTLENPWNLGLYLQEATRLIHEINQAGKLPILSGGTGQYIRAVLKGWEVPSQMAVEPLREALEAWGETVGFEELHRKLSLLDPVSAAQIDYRNKRRTIRAWEVILTSGRRFSEQRTRSDPPYQKLVIGLNLPRDVLYAGLDERLERMLASGFLEEVRLLKERGLTDPMKTMGIIGYTELSDYLDGQIDFDEALRRIRHNTRVYVRRQANWFKPSDPEIHWLDARDPALLEKMLDLVKSNLD